MGVEVRNWIYLVTKHGAAKLYTFKGLCDVREHVALVFGDVLHDPYPYVRLHSECVTGDAFGSLRCDCGPQLEEAMRTFSASGGIILYLRQEGRDIGLYNKIDSYRLQQEGHDTFEANEKLGFQHDHRNYKVAAEMLLALGVHEIFLLSNNPDKVKQLNENGIVVRNLVNTGCYMTPYNQPYLYAKQEKAGHQLGIEGVKIVWARLTSPDSSCLS